MELKPVNMWIALLFIKTRDFFSSFLCRHFHDSTYKWLKEPQADVQEIREAAQRSPLSRDGGESTFSPTPKASWLPIMRNGSVAGVLQPASDAARNSGQACRSCSSSTQGQAAVAMVTTLDAAEKTLGGKEPPWHEE